MKEEYIKIGKIDIKKYSGLCNEKIITDLIDRKEYLIEKKNKLYPVNKKNDK